MKVLSKQATVIFRKLTAELNAPGDARTIDNTDGLFMPVHIDFVWKNEHGQIFSVAHYYEQNGDLMSDPDMTFLVTGDYILPMTYRQDAIGINQTGILANDGESLKADIKRQKELATFANQWMHNIKTQQKL